MKETVYKYRVTNILANDYGTTITTAPEAVVLWACAKCDEPKTALRVANKVRAKDGQPLVYAPYGDVCY